jgi:hypothetical protein
MRSELRFVMHPDDEREFVDALLLDASLVLINGPRWKTREPTVYRSLDFIDNYCMIWCREAALHLDAEFIPKCNDWYCRSEGATIQFRRSHVDGSVLTLGRLAVSTDVEPPEVAKSVEQRYGKLRKFIQKQYRNSVLRWWNPNLPVSPATAGRSSNPSKPDNTVWIGLAAFKWLEAEPKLRRVKQWTSSVVEGELAHEADMEVPDSGHS